MKLTHFDEVALTREQIRDCTKLVMTNFNMLPYKKITKGQYELYCPYCQTYHRITSVELKTIQITKECPTCHQKFSRTTREDYYEAHDYVYIDGYGYIFEAKWKFGEPITLIKHEQIAAFFDKTWIKCGYFLGNFARGIYFSEDQYSSLYRESHSPNWLPNFYKYHDCEWVYLYGSKKAKKQMLERFATYIEKSDQKKILADNTVPFRNIPFFKLFDLHSYEDYKRNEQWMFKNQYEAKENMNKYQFNVFYLDYLVRNNISLSRYLSYAEKMKTLNLKLDKPSNYTVREEIVENMYDLLMNKELTEKIAKRYNSLPNYETEHITIKPFKTKAEMVRCGRELSNCIGRNYVESYAKGNTDVYHLDEDGKMTIAIEILNKALWQARSYDNGKCPKKYLDHIKQFCDRNGFTYARFA